MQLPWTFLKTPFLIPSLFLDSIHPELLTNESEIIYLVAILGNYAVKLQELKSTAKSP